MFSSRKLENATYDSVAFRFVAADEHLEHDTLNTFCKRFLKDKVNASRRSALSYGYIKKLEEQLKGELKKLMELAEAANNEKIPDGMNLLEVIALREDRIKAITEAKTKIV